MLGGEYLIGENEQGMVDTFYRRVMLTVEQIAERYVPTGADGRPDWGRVPVSDTLKQAYASGRWDEAFELVQHIGPQPFVEPLLARRGPRYQEVVFQPDNPQMDEVEGAFIVRNELEVLPAFCVRWDKMGGSPWGVSPCMDALPDVKQLQEMEEKKAVALTLEIDPPLKGPASLEHRRISTLPGDITFTDGGAEQFGPLYEVRPNLAAMGLEMDRVETRIRRALHSDLFKAFLDRVGVQPLNEEEIWERKEEKLLGLGQVLDRFDREMIRPVVDISLHHLSATGQLDDPPEGLEEMDIEYRNVIAVAQQTQGLTAISDTVSFAMTFARQQVEVGQDPTAMDTIDVDKTVREFAERRGADLSIMLDEDDVEELREQRAEARAAAAQAEAAQAEASAAKDMAAAEELASRTQADQGPMATGGGPGTLPADMGVGPV